MKKASKKITLEELARMTARGFEVITSRMATKADIANMATKDDLVGLATKEDIKDMATKADLLRMATKEDIANMATKDDLLKVATKADIHMQAMEHRLGTRITEIKDWSEQRFVKKPEYN